jgi:uncharacterized tellurite resistance protein B-like protein
MEFLGIILVFVAIVVIRAVLTAGAKTTVAAAKAVVGRGSFSENMDQQFHGMGAFRVRAEFKTSHGDTPFDAYHIECRGLIPVRRPRRIAFVMSLLDVTDDDDTRPVLCAMDTFQEPQTIAFQYHMEGSTIKPDQGFTGWVPVGFVIPEILTPPEQGLRKMMVVARVVDADMTPQITMGYGNESDPAVIAVAVCHFEHTFKGSGYEEAAAAQATARLLTIKLAVAMAMADGALADAEGSTIQAWIRKQLSTLDDDEREVVKISCNDALRDSHATGARGELSLSPIIKEFNEIGNEPLKYRAIELCLDVMAADGEASPAELEMVKNLTHSLGLDFGELQKMKDQRMVKVNVALTDESSTEALLGIDPAWSSEEINKHLRNEFAKWNGRLNALDDPEERANAQRMLDAISAARRKYAA